MSDRSYLFSEVLFGMIHDNVKRRDYVFRRMSLCHSYPLSEEGAVLSDYKTTRIGVRRMSCCRDEKSIDVNDLRRTLLLSVSLPHL